MTLSLTDNPLRWALALTILLACVVNVDTGGADEEYEDIPVEISVDFD